MTASRLPRRIERQRMSSPTTRLCVISTTPCVAEPLRSRFVSGARRAPFAESVQTSATADLLSRRSCPSHASIAVQARLGAGKPAWAANQGADSGRAAEPWDDPSAGAFSNAGVRTAPPKRHRCEGRIYTRSHLEVLFLLAGKGSRSSHDSSYVPSNGVVRVPPAHDGSAGFFRGVLGREEAAHAGWLRSRSRVPGRNRSGRAGRSAAREGAWAMNVPRTGPSSFGGCRRSQIDSEYSLPNRVRWRLAW